MIDEAAETIMVPLPLIATNTLGVAEIPTATMTIAWEFHKLQLEFPDGMLHYNCDEPPWAAQIRNAMSYVMSRLERAHG